MFEKSYKKQNEAERAYWAHTKAQGKRRFVLRELMFNMILWFGIIVVVDFKDHPHPNSVWSLASTAIIMLPISLLGGCLSAKWKWNDFEKKYPE